MENWRELVRAGSLKLEPGIRVTVGAAQQGVVENYTCPVCGHQRVSADGKYCDNVECVAAQGSPGVVAARGSTGVVVHYENRLEEGLTYDFNPLRELDNLDLVDCGATRGAILDQLRERWNVPRLTLFFIEMDDGWVLDPPVDALFGLHDATELGLLLKAIAVPR